MTSLACRGMAPSMRSQQPLHGTTMEHSCLIISTAQRLPRTTHICVSTVKRLHPHRCRLPFRHTSSQQRRSQRCAAAHSSLPVANSCGVLWLLTLITQLQLHLSTTRCKYFSIQLTIRGCRLLQGKRHMPSDGQPLGTKLAHGATGSCPCHRSARLPIRSDEPSMLHCGSSLTVVRADRIGNVLAQIEFAKAHWRLFIYAGYVLVLVWMANCRPE